MRKRLAADMEASSPVRGQSSNSGVREVVDSVIIQNNRLHGGNEVTVGFSLVRT
jgi:hypothetical protein